MQREKIAMRRGAAFRTDHLTMIVTERSKREIDATGTRWFNNVTVACMQDKFTALYMAAQIGQQEIVTLLLAHGANPTLTTKVWLWSQNHVITE